MHFASALSFFAFAASLASAMPTASGPTIAIATGQSYESSARQQNHNQVQCKSYFGTGHNNDSLKPCQPFCGNLTDAANGNIKSVSCFAAAGPGQSFQKYTDNIGQYTMGVCRCNIPALDQVVNGVVLALPAIADIGCEVIVKSFETVLQVGSMAIPGAGEIKAADAGTQAIVKGAQMLKKAGKGSADMLSWFHPCGQSQFTQGIDKVFNDATLGMV